MNDNKTLWGRRLILASALMAGAALSGCVAYEPVPVAPGYYAAPAPVVSGYYYERSPSRYYYGGGRSYYRDRGYRGGDYRGDRDDNPPGPRGGPGTNWENPPGPRGGPGASPDRRRW